MKIILFVEKVFASYLLEGGKARGPARHDFLWCYPRLQLLDGFCVSYKQKEFRRIKLLRVVLLQRHRDFQSHAHCADRSTVRDEHRRTAAALAAVRAADGNEGLSYETNSRKTALIESRGHCFTINPRRAKFFERRLRPAADGDARAL